MSADLIKFPEQTTTIQADPFMAMTMTKIVNGKTVIMNIAKMSKEEFLAALLNDSAMREKQDLVAKCINN